MFNCLQMLSIWSSPKLCCLVQGYQPLLILHKPVPKRQILDSSKLDENGRKFSKQVENTLGKAEIARYEQFLLFPQCFQNTLYCRHVKTRACLGKG